MVYDIDGKKTVDDDLGGSGELVKKGDGTLTLTGANTYTGGTTIDKGTLQIGDGGTSGWIIGDVTDNGTLVFNRSDDVSFDGIISGSGALQHIGDGTLLLTAANTYTGGTTVRGGILEVATGGALGTGSVTLDGDSYNATLQVDKGASLSNHIVMVGTNAFLDNYGAVGGDVDNAVGGPGGTDAAVINQEGGSIKANGTAVSLKDGAVANYSGGTIEGGTLGVALTHGGSVVNDGEGSAIRSADGTAVQITGANGIVFNQEGGKVTGGSIAIYLEHGGQITNRSGSTIETTGTATGNCQDKGSCSIFVPTASDNPDGDAGHPLNLVNAGTIIGDVQMDALAINFLSMTAGSSVQGDLDMGSNNSSGLILNSAAGTERLYSEAVTGTTTFAGLLEKAGDGTWIIDNEELDAVDHTWIDGGTLQVGTGGTAGSIGQGDIKVNDGALVFDRSDAVGFAGDIGGWGQEGSHTSLVQSGSGTLILTGRVFSLDDITIKSGTLQVGDGAEAGSVDGDVVNNGALAFNRSDEVAFDGLISGTGSLVQKGAGTLILSAANTYAGGTVVSNGTLRTWKELPGNAMVSVAAVLGGAANGGTPPGLPGVAGDLSNAGTVIVRAGDTMVGGDYVQGAAGTLAVSLGSKLDVAGTATLNGGTLEVTGADDGYVANTHTQVLTAAGGVSGTFDQLVKDTGVVFTATTINYGTNEVWLDTTGLDVTTAAAGGGVYYTPASMGSARRVQGAFEQLDTKVADGSLDSVADSFVRAAGQFQQSPNLRAAQASLESLSGQLHASSAAMTLHTIDVTGRALSARLEKLSALGGDHLQGVWMNNLRLDGDMTRSGYGDVSYRLNGWLVGRDLRLGAHSLVGFAFSQGRGAEQLSGRFDRNHSRNTSGMVYAGWADHDWYAHARVGMGHYRQSIDRMLLLGTRYRGVWTGYGGNYNVAHGESGRHFGLGAAQLTPFVDLQYARVTRDGFAERGGGGFGLKADGRTVQRWQGGIGMKLSRQWQFSGGRSISLDARAQWRRALSTSGAAFDASFTGLDEWRPLTGVGLSRRGAVFGLDLQAVPSANTRFKLGYEYLTGRRGRAGAASAHVSLLF